MDRRHFVQALSLVPVVPLVGFQQGQQVIEEGPYLFFVQGQRLGEHDLPIYILNAAEEPVDVAQITYALYRVEGEKERLQLPGVRVVPRRTGVGCYHAGFSIRHDAPLGHYRIRWSIQETKDGPIHPNCQDFRIKPSWSRS